MKKNVIIERIDVYHNRILHLSSLFLSFFLILSCTTTNAQTTNPSKEDVWHKDELRILDIGNSYTEDATSFLSSMVKKANIDTKDICLYKIIYGGSSFSTWVKTYHGLNKTKYTFTKVLGKLSPTRQIESSTSELNDSTLLHLVLDSCKWDIIIIHQNSLYAPYYEKYNDLSELLSIINKCQKDALIGTYLIHSYWDEYGDNKEKSSEIRWNLIAQATKQICKDYNIDFVIPYGTAIENLRLTSYNRWHDLTRDDTHLGFGLAQYTANCCYFESVLKKRYNVSMYGIDMNYKVSDNYLSKYGEGCVDITEESNIIAQKAALYACEDMFNLWNPEKEIIGTKNISEKDVYKNVLDTNCKNINFTRSFNNTSWQALYIPFSMSYNDWKNDFEVAYINSIHQFDKDDDGVIDETTMNVVKIKNGSLIHNTPYLIRAKTIGEKTITVSDATLYKAEENSIDCRTTIAEYTFTGTYKTIRVSTLIENNYYAMDGGSLIITNETSDLKPFRWYMKIDSRSPMYNVTNEARTITINVVGEEETTDIKELRMTNDKSPIYDLNGRMVDENILKSGIYIKNGKKYVK